MENLDKEKFFEKMPDLILSEEKLLFQRKKIGTIVSDDYDNPEEYFKGHIEIEENCPDRIINYLSEKNYFLIFNCKGCISK